jgi:hypothetical protein
MSVLENRARLHDSPPLHVHTTEDELFIILDGKLRLRVGADERTAGPGTVLLAPGGPPTEAALEAFARAARVRDRAGRPPLEDDQEDPMTR